MKRKAMIANMEFRKESKTLRWNLWFWRPDYVVINQGGPCRPWLQSTFGNKYIIVHAPNNLGDEAKHVLLMTRTSRNSILSTNFKKMSLEWRGPKKGLLHEPRVYVKQHVEARDRKRRQTIRIAGVHFETGGPHGPNREVWLDSLDWAVDWLLDTPNADLPSLVFGDMNATFDELKKELNGTGIQRWSKAKVCHFMGRNIHWARVRRVRTPKGHHGWSLITFGV